MAKRQAWGAVAWTLASKKIMGQVDVLEEYHDEVLELLGRMFSPEEVQRIIIEEHHIPCSLEAIVVFRKKYLQQVTAKIEQFKRDWSEIRLAHKKGRIEELVYLYTSVKNRFLATQGISDREYLLKVLESLRKETDGDLIKIEGNLDLNIESTVNIHLKNEVLGQLNLTQLILSRVASRMGQNPVRLVKKLVDSHYSRFNGMVGDVVDAEYEELKYPSTQAYDFDNIKQQYKVITKEDLEADKKLVQQEEEASQSVDGDDFKETLLKRIGERREANRVKGAQPTQMLLEKKVREAEERINAKRPKKS